MRLITFLYLFIILSQSVFGKLLINEFVTNTQDDWVELKLIDEESMEISNLFVTPYYGQNEKLSDSPVTIRNSDIASTNYDDRFVIIHLSNSSSPDETDATGDSNGNGYLDIYCNNYYSSLWNTEGVVAIDSDDDPKNGDIIDFVAYSNRDGTPHNTMSKYIKYAIEKNQWSPNSTNTQQISVDIGKDGLNSYQSIARKDCADSNTLSDFAVTKYQTPGRANIFLETKNNSSPFILNSDKITSKNLTDAQLLFLLNEKGHIKIRVFSSIGILLYATSVDSQLFPGRHKFSIPHNIFPVTGLYIGTIEYSSTASKQITTKKFFIISQKNR